MLDWGHDYAGTALINVSSPHERRRPFKGPPSHLSDPLGVPGFALHFTSQPFWADVMETTGSSLIGTLWQLIASTPCPWISWI